MIPRLCLLALTLALPLIVGTESAYAAGPPIPHCSPGPEDCSGWFKDRTSPSRGHGTTNGCASRTAVFTTIPRPTPLSTELSVSCSVSYGGAPPLKTDGADSDATLRRSSNQRPRIRHGLRTREELVQPAALGFFRRYRCDVGDRVVHESVVRERRRRSASVSGSCTDVAGNSSRASFGFKYDATPPVVTASPDRQPDGKGGTESRSRSASPAPTGPPGSRPAPPRPGTRAPTRQGDRRRRLPRRGREHGRGGPGLPVRRDGAEASGGEGRSREGRRQDRLEALAGRGARRARAQPRRERQEEDHCLPRQRSELHRQDRAQGRPLSLRDQSERRSGEHDREGRHGDRRLAGALPAGGRRRRPGAARPRLGGRQGSDLLQHPALPEQGEGADVLAEDADVPHRQDLALRGQAPAARAGPVRLVRLGRRGTRAKPQYGKLLGSSSFVVK